MVKTYTLGCRSGHKTTQELADGHLEAMEANIWYPTCGEIDEKGKPCFKNLKIITEKGDMSAEL